MLFFCKCKNECSSRSTLTLVKHYNIMQLFVYAVLLIGLSWGIELNCVNLILKYWFIIYSVWVGAWPLSLSSHVPLTVQSIVIPNCQTEYMKFVSINYWDQLKCLSLDINSSRWKKLQHVQILVCFDMWLAEYWTMFNIGEILKLSFCSFFIFYL